MVLGCCASHAVLPREPPRPPCSISPRTGTSVCCLRCGGSIRFWAAMRMCLVVANAGAGALSACWHGGALTLGRDNGDRASHSCSAGGISCCAPSGRSASCRTLAARLLHAASSPSWLAPLVKRLPRRGSASLHKQELCPFGHYDESFCPAWQLRQLRRVRCLSARRAAAGPLHLSAVLQRVCDISRLQALPGSLSESSTLLKGGGVAAVRCHPGRCAAPCTPCAG